MSIGLMYSGYSRVHSAPDRGAYAFRLPACLPPVPLPPTLPLAKTWLTLNLPSLSSVISTLLRHCAVQYQWHGSGLFSLARQKDL